MPSTQIIQKLSKQFWHGWREVMLINISVSLFLHDHIYPLTYQSSKPYRHNYPLCSEHEFPGSRKAKIAFFPCHLVYVFHISRSRSWIWLQNGSWRILFSLADFQMLHCYPRLQKVCMVWIFENVLHMPMEIFLKGTYNRTLEVSEEPPSLEEVIPNSYFFNAKCQRVSAKFNWLKVYRFHI